MVHSSKYGKFPVDYLSDVIPGSHVFSENIVITSWDLPIEL